LTSSIFGIELAAPNLVVDIPATLFAKINASLFLYSLAKAKANAPLNASPAPVVSTTFDLSLKAST